MPPSLFHDSSIFEAFTQRLSEESTSVLKAKGTRPPIPVRLDEITFEQIETSAKEHGCTSGTGDVQGKAQEGAIWNTIQWVLVGLISKILLLFSLIKTEPLTADTPDVIYTDSAEVL